VENKHNNFTKSLLGEVRVSPSYIKILKKKIGFSLVLKNAFSLLFPSSSPCAYYHKRVSQINVWSLLHL